MKKTKRILAVLMTLTLMLVFVPMTAYAGVATPTQTGSVTVTVTNATDKSAPADEQGEFLRQEVQLTPGMTVGEAIQEVCDQASVTVNGIAGGYVTDIGGLKDGWMCAVNNWFSNVSPYSGLAEDGDIISMEYSMDWGGDIGSSWDNNNKTLQSLSVDQGALSPDFASDVHNYTLTLPAGTDSILVTPIAMNRNFMVKTSVGGTEYKLSAGVPVADGTVITVISGDPNWPSANNGSGAESVPAETYTITIAYDDTVDNGGGVDNGGTDNGGGVTIEKDNSPKTGDANTMLPLTMMLGLIGIGGAFVVKRRTN